MKEQMPSWSFLGGSLEHVAAGSEPSRANWTSVEAWSNVAEMGLAATLEDLAAAMSSWDEQLGDLKEVARLDWRRFRPLRLGREEQWSDWLAHLLENSEFGELACRMFGCWGRHSPDVHALPMVEREVWAGRMKCRADLVIHWAGGETTHLEVKVGDRQFEKTFGTARHLELKLKQQPPLLRHFILLPDEHIDEWLVVAGSRDTVSYLDWNRVAVSLREVLRSRRESLPWRAWAHSYCGAIEQRLLGMLPFGELKNAERSVFERLATAVKLLKVMNGDDQ